MENIDLINSFTEFKSDKMIDRVTLMSILEDVFRSTLNKKLGGSENFDIIVNPDKGDLAIFRNRVVVPDGEVENSNKEISLSDARNIEDDFEVGEDVSEEIKLSQLGRRTIMTLRQNLKSRITEHDNTSKYKQFKDLIGEIYSAEVHHIRRNAIILLDDDGQEIIMLKKDKIFSDFFRKGDIVKGVIKDVEMNGNKTQIFMSRTSNTFLEKLFEQEIPEVFDGLIEVKKVARIPGEKAKVIVDTYDDRVDPVGACVGARGSRIHGIVRELGNENIDVISHTNNSHLLITRALSPAKIISIDINEEDKTAKVILDSEEMSKAIGKGGSNIRLALEITGYNIDVFAEGQEEDVELELFKDEVDEWIIDEFKKVGLDTAKSVLDYSVEDLIKRVDLEEETILDVIRVLKSEFELE